MTCTLRFLGAGLLLFAAPSPALAAEVEQWGLFELSLRGPAGGNPFAVELSATFTQGEKKVRVVRANSKSAGRQPVRSVEREATRHTRVSKGRWARPSVATPYR